MAEIGWSRAVTARSPRTISATLARQIRPGILDWEDLLTLGIAMCAVVAVSATLEGAGWSRQMPALTLVSVLALPAGMALARSRMSMFVAWPLGIVLGAAVTFWQTLEMVGPGSLEQRVDAIYWRFERWFNLAFGAPGVNNDPLPFNVLVLGLTWLGVFLFAWAVFRWHNAWPGLIPGGVALFLDLVFVGSALTTASILYVLFGFLLLMRTNLTSRIARWRAEGVPYPPLISLTFLHFSVWALLALIMVGWLSPTGPFSTPPVVQALARGVESVTVDVVRLAGPLHVKKVVPVHNYTALLPFQGSVKLGERELLSVTVRDPTLEGPFLLRGAVYDTYSAGGWEAGAREEVGLPRQAERHLRNELGNDRVSGMLVPLSVKVRAKSVVGTVVFSAGQPVASDRALTVDVPAGSIRARWPGELGITGSARLSDQEVANRLLAEDLIVFGIERDVRGRVASIDVFDTSSQPLPDALVLDPGSRIRKGQTYQALGFIPTFEAEDLKRAGLGYPQWVRDLYLQLPESTPELSEVATLAADVAGREATPYDKAKAIEQYVRTYPVDFKIDETPPGRDTVHYFLFEARRGYFDYHASAMVVMLRTLNVPSRLGVGFVVDEADLNEETGSYLVRDKNAYAWAEVYFPGYGWVPFNPSPDRPPELIPHKRGTAVFAGGTPGLEDFPDLPVTGADRILERLGEDALVGGGSSSFGSRQDGYAPWTVLGVLAFVTALVMAVRLGWQRSVAGLPYSQQVWEKTVRLASWAGHPPEAGQTPAEYARRLERVFRGVRGLSLIAEVYNRSRFGRRDADPAERERIDEVWPQVRAASMNAIVRRILRRQ